MRLGEVVGLGVGAGVAAGQPVQPPLVTDTVAVGEPLTVIVIVFPP